MSSFTTRTHPHIPLRTNGKKKYQLFCACADTTIQQNRWEQSFQLTLLLYGSNESPPIRATLMLIEILGIQVQFKEVYLPTRDHYKQEYLEKKPLHTIPMLEDDDYRIVDRHAILPYLWKSKGLTELHVKSIEEAYDIAEKYLEQTKYIATDSLTVADLSCGDSFFFEFDSTDNECTVERVKGKLAQVRRAAAVGGDVPKALVAHSHRLQLTEAGWRTLIPVSMSTG
ncbi:unnamed protein product [Chilo suppressalis]|uniref:GST N-terminal domain-containing protein n=1 Tax=Chilo suppressalis TaxID=168631 RepID=A0ABN8AYX3_CHISP|nr:unnamed protein product [Chilo suppressalis]